jgi:orotate phosphoribosyltransferase
MTEITLATLLKLVPSRRGHFLLESGYHGELWLDLDPLFADARRIAPLVAELSDSLRPYDVGFVCGPLLGGAFLAQLVAQAIAADFCYTVRELSRESGGLYAARYRLPPAFSTRIRGKRGAIVDDCMSAGSSLRATFAELARHDAVPVVAGALLVFGTAGLDFFADQNVPVESVIREEYQLWLPLECPHCLAGVPLENVAAPAKP